MSVQSSLFNVCPRCGERTVRPVALCPKCGFSTVYRKGSVVPFLVTAMLIVGLAYMCTALWQRYIVRSAPFIGAWKNSRMSIRFEAQNTVSTDAYFDHSGHLHELSKHISGTWSNAGGLLSLALTSSGGSQIISRIDWQLTPGSNEMTMTGVADDNSMGTTVTVIKQ